MTTAEFVDIAGRGSRLLVLHTPTAPPRAAIVHVHAFAEEMNKSRRMVAIQSRALADAGFAVLQIDLAGCGDSSGDVADVGWDDWLEDLRFAADAMQRRHAGVPLVLWGLRAGALVAAAAAARFGIEAEFLFWQPVTSGAQQLQQFLRLRTAANLMGGEAKSTGAALRAALNAGQTVQIAGYDLPAALANGLDDARLVAPAGAHRVAWIEVSPRADATLSAASAQPIAQWHSAGLQVRPEVVNGPAFWQSVEIEEAPALVPATLAAAAWLTGS